MRALLVHAPYTATLSEINMPTPPSRWVLVKTLAVGICGTDKAFYTGRYQLFKKPLIPGHEVVGVVVSPSELKGRVVVSEINFSCGKCYYCRLGLYTHCPYKKTLGIDFDGGFAEYFIAPLIALHDVEGLDPVIATQIEPLAAVLNALEQYPLTPSSKIAIIGTGNLAHLIVQVLRANNVNVVVIAKRGSKKIQYFTSLGVEVVFKDEIEEYIKKNTPEGSGFDVVFEASGDPRALNTAINITRPRGVIHLKSTPGEIFTVDMTKAVVKELRVIGTRCGTFREFKRAIELIKSNAVKPFITTVFKGIEKSAEALEKSIRGEDIKVVVKL